MNPYPSRRGFSLWSWFPGRGFRQIAGVVMDIIGFGEDFIARQRFRIVGSGAVVVAVVNVGRSIHGIVGGFGERVASGRLRFDHVVRCVIPGVGCQIVTGRARIVDAVSLRPVDAAPRVEFRFALGDQDWRCRAPPSFRNGGSAQIIECGDGLKLVGAIVDDGGCEPISPVVFHFGDAVIGTGIVHRPGHLRQIAVPAVRSVVVLVLDRFLHIVAGCPAAGRTGVGGSVIFGPHPLAVDQRANVVDRPGYRSGRCFHPVLASDRIIVKLCFVVAGCCVPITG